MNTYNGSLRIGFIVKGDSGFESVQEAARDISESTSNFRTDLALLVIKHRKEGLQIFQSDDTPEVIVAIDSEESE